MQSTQILLLNKEAPSQSLIITKQEFVKVHLTGDVPTLQHRDKVVHEGVTYLITERTYDIETNTMLLKTKQTR